MSQYQSAICNFYLFTTTGTEFPLVNTYNNMMTIFLFNSEHVPTKFVVYIFREFIDCRFSKDESVPFKVKQSAPQKAKKVTTWQYLSLFVAHFIEVHH